MPDRREEILNKEHQAFVKDEGTASIHTRNFPEAYKLQAFAAMDEYMKECALELLAYMSKNQVVCGTLSGNEQFWFKNEWISKEQLFENFL
jgi:hypothetical protein